MTAGETFGELWEAAIHVAQLSSAADG